MDAQIHREPSIKDNPNTERIILNTSQNVDVLIKNNSKNENENQRYDLYLRFVQIFCMIIEFILCIAFTVVETVIKDKNEIFKTHYSGIAAISTFFFIYFILFIAELIYFCISKVKNFEIIGIISFWFSQIFYFIDLFMIPSYYSRIIYEDEKEIKKVSDIKRRYRNLIIVSQIFSLFIIFLDFIVINLYKDLCCKMDEICDITNEFINNLWLCIKDLISRIICKSNNEEDEEIKKIVEESKKQKEEINSLNEEIRHLLSQHIDLKIKNI